jgi:hypothetical protein
VLIRAVAPNDVVIPVQFSGGDTQKVMAAKTIAFIEQLYTRGIDQISILNFYLMGISEKAKQRIDWAVEAQEAANGYIEANLGGLRQEVAHTIQSWYRRQDWWDGFKEGICADVQDAYERYEGEIPESEYPIIYAFDGGDFANNASLKYRLDSIYLDDLQDSNFDEVPLEKLTPELLSFILQDSTFAKMQKFVKF